MSVEELGFFNLHPCSRAQVLNCHFQVLPKTKQNTHYFNLLNFQEKVFKNWYGKLYSYSAALLLGYYM